MKPSPEQLEQMIHRTLKSLPNRPAPRSLESRVLAAIEARASLPWWKQSFSHWPLAARGVFLVAATAVVALFLFATVRATAGFSHSELANSFSTRFSQLESLNQMARQAGSVCLRWVGQIPALWLYAALAGLASVYATLFGIGATAYRTLFADRS
jgi:hypothetical protein